MDEQVPDWFENLDDDELDRRERASRGAGFWIAVVSVLIVLGMAVIPLLDILDLGSDTGPSEPRLSPARQLAWSFGVAVLQTRSVDDAMRYAALDQRPAVAAIVDDLRGLEPATLDGAQLGVGVVRCVDAVPASGECFVAWLYRTGQPEIARIGYVVSATADGPLVIRVGRVAPRTAGR